MKGAIHKTYYLIRTFRQINRTNLDKRLKSEIKSTYFKAFYLGKYDAQSSTTRIAGFRVHG